MGIPMAVMEGGATLLPLSGVTVLLADDEALLRGLIADQLHDLGATVVEAENGAVALELFRSNPNLYGLVILDQVMPRMKGSEVFAAIHAEKPGLSVVIASGFLAGMLLSELEGLGLRWFLQKPFCCCEFTKVVLAAIDTSQPQVIPPPRIIQ